MDWVGTVDVLIREAKANLPPNQHKSITSSFLAKHFQLGVGSIMRYYSIWKNLHSEALKEFISWGDADYRELAKEYTIPLTEENLEKFDEIEVVGKTSMYPGVWNKASQSSDLQLKMLSKMMRTHLKTKPPSSLNLSNVKLCLKYVLNGNNSLKVIDKLKEDATGSVNVGLLNNVDVDPFLVACDRMAEDIKRGEHDGKMSGHGQYPSKDIAMLANRLETIKMLTFKRQQEKEKKEKAAAEVLFFFN